MIGNFLDENVEISTAVGEQQIIMFLNTSAGEKKNGEKSLDIE